MAGFFKFILYLGVVVGLLGFVMPMFVEQRWVAELPPQTKTYLSFGGLGLIMVGLIGRTFTRREEVEWR